MALERAARLIEAQEQTWRAMFADLRIAPLEIWYEDAEADPQAAVARVADYLEVALDPSADVDVPAIERQAQRGARAWAERHQSG